MTQILHRNCPQCYADNSAHPYLPISSQDWPIKRCSLCNFVYLERAPNYEKLSVAFAWEKTSAQVEIRRLKEEPIVRGLSQLFKRFRGTVLKRNKLLRLISYYVGGPGGQMIVDLGCARGGVLSRLSPQYHRIGIEISAALSKQARELMPDAQIIHADAVSGLRSLPQGSCLGIIMSAFLEHEIEPQLLLFYAWCTLKPDGVCIIKVPNFGSWNRLLRRKKWCGLRFPDHVNYFTPQSLRRMVVSLGFKVARFGILDRLPTSDNMWMVLRMPNKSPEPTCTAVTPPACSRVALSRVETSP